MDISHARYMERQYFAGLDGIRCIAVLAVIWHHSVGWTTPAIATRGFIGVDLFFLLSGFLIATLLIREKQRNGRISLKNFWARRMLRLFPAYYFMLAALTIISVLFRSGSPGTTALLSGLPVYALYLSNWIHPNAPNLGHTWSLATEEQFYLVWPVVEAFASHFLAWLILLALILVNQLLNFGLLDAIVTADARAHLEILQITFTPILLGVGLAHALHWSKSHSMVHKIAGFRGAPGFFAALFIAVMCLPAADISGTLRLLIHVTGCLFIAAVVLAPTSAITTALELRPIRFLGMVSYGMYLYHMIALHGARALVSKLGLPEFPGVFLIGTALTVIGAAVSYAYLEARFLNLRRRFRDAEPIEARVAPARSGS